MELKEFQQQVLEAFANYLDVLQAKKEQSDRQRKLAKENPDAGIRVSDFTEETWNALRAGNKLPRSRDHIPFSPRRDGIGNPVPSVCFKVPTGGGKTVLAAHAVSRLMSQWVKRNTGFVLWIMPNESIYAQTKKALLNREHAYRQILDRTAAGYVKILEKNDRLDRRDIESHLCVMLLMLQSANRQTKESLRMFRDRGNVHGFFPPTDDVLKHSDCILQIPNLDVYGDKHNIGAVVKESLGNVVRLLRPLVILDEGHKGYSRLAMETLYGFNPSFVLELTATPVDRPKDNPPMFSNWLVDVRGTDLDKEHMVKLPINVTVQGGDDWKDCLRTSYEFTNSLQEHADRLRANTSRYIRPICLIQVERTGKDHRDGQYIHAEDAREYLLTLGAEQEEIAIKTSDKNELNQPENLNLEEPTNQIRFIITKQALQEGWDCPFAYVLCSLATVTSKGAMTQLLGRILRQPDTIKTKVDLLDECYVFCHHSATRDVVTAIKNGLEQDGMADLATEIKTKDASGQTGSELREIARRDEFKKLKVFLPLVLWTEETETRELDYDADVLFNIDWANFDVAPVIEKIPITDKGDITQIVRIDFEQSEGGTDFFREEELDASAIPTEFDPAYVTRSIVDIVPNPWIAREYVATVIKGLHKRGFTREQLGAVSNYIVDTLRSHLMKERDRLAEAKFLELVEQGVIQFRLRTDSNNWIMPKVMTTNRAPISPLLQRDDGKVVEKNLFDPQYRDDLNKYEQKVACYLDGEQALKWWHRNVARKQYGIQGWRRHKIYPDLIFAMTNKNNVERMFVLETKGDQLDNPDTAYKRNLLDICTDAFNLEQVHSAGELELVTTDGKSLKCALIFEDNWKTELSQLLEYQ